MTFIIQKVLKQIPEMGDLETNNILIFLFLFQLMKKTFKINSKNQEINGVQLISSYLLFLVITCS